MPAAARAGIAPADPGSVGIAPHEEDREAAIGIRYRLRDDDPPLVHWLVLVDPAQLNGRLVGTDAEAERIELGVDLLDGSALLEAQFGNRGRVELDGALLVGERELLLVEEIRGPVGELMALVLGGLLQVLLGLMGSHLDRLPDRPLLERQQSCALVGELVQESEEARLDLGMSLGQFELGGSARELGLEVRDHAVPLLGDSGLLILCRIDDSARSTLIHNQVTPSCLSPRGGRMPSHY